MLKTNEFNFRLNPLKPGVIALELTKRSKRNIIIRKVMAVAFATVSVMAVGAAIEAATDESSSKDQQTDPNTD